MKKQRTLLLMGTLFLLSIRASAQTNLSLETAPFRFVYGVNAQLNFELPGRQLISVQYQDHQRDYFSIPSVSDDINLLPQLYEASGSTCFISFMLPLENAGKARFWYGPKFGQKHLKGFAKSVNFQGIERSVKIDQRNNYYLGQFVLQYSLGSFYLGGYLHLGVVHIRWEDQRFNPDGSLYLTGDGWDNLWSPHALGGISVGARF